MNIDKIHCFSGDQRIEIMISDGYMRHFETAAFKNLYDNYKDSILSVYHKNEYKRCNVIRTEGKDLYHIVTELDDDIKVTCDHINVTERGDVLTTDLTLDDKIAYWNSGKNEVIYYKIKSIEKLPSEEYSYCLEMYDQRDPYFTLPNGIITHNCNK